MRKGYCTIYGAVIHSKGDHIKLLLTASMVNRFVSTVKAAVFNVHLDKLFLNLFLISYKA